MSKKGDLSTLIGMILLLIVLLVSIVVFVSPIRKSFLNFIDVVKKEKKEVPLAPVCETIFFDIPLSSVIKSDNVNLNYIVGNERVEISSCTEEQCAFLMQKAKLYCQNFKINSIIINGKCWSKDCKNIVEKCDDVSRGEVGEIYFIKPKEGTKKYYAVVLREGEI